MKGLTAIVGLLAVLLVAITIAGLSSIQGDVGRPSHEREIQQLDMLESDMAMLEQMRASTSPVMMTMIQDDRMWTDPDMIRVQEEYQAQLDRMLGRRPAPP
ncbi:MAG TPA: hypothetical protein VF148_16725 [Acidimicrobiia bacterium]